MARYLIVGGVAGGATTAARLRRLDEKAEITVFERGEYISYANCGLPYHIGNVISDRDRLILQTPESFAQRLNVDVKVRHEVTKIDPLSKEIVVHDLVSGRESRESYDKLILSPGAEPVRPNLPGMNDPAIFTLRSVPDMDAIIKFVETKKPRRVVIVGAGFIGLEMAENLHHRGVFVTIVEMAEQVMTPLDYEMAAEVHQHLKRKGVEFYLSEAVSSFQRHGDKLGCCLKSGRCLNTDLAILSIGVRPETKLARDAGLEIGQANGIRVNEYLQTSNPDIYAVGDAIEFPHPVLKSPYCAYLAGPANRQGRLCADNIVLGNTRAYTGSIATAIAKVFDITVAATGVSEKLLRKAGVPHLASITHGASHAGYYPDALPLTVKLLFAPETGTVYGAQIVGYEGVDKRIDLIATVIKRGGTIYDLQEIEHAYAPPFSSAKDPVHIAAYVAENILNHRMNIIHWHEIEKLGEDDCLVDVRTKAEFELGTIEGARNIPVDELRDRLPELPKAKRIVIFCGVGQRGYLASRILTQNGFRTVNLSGGYKTWEHAVSKQGNGDIFADSSIRSDDHIYQDLKPVTPVTPATATGKVLEVDACGLQCPGPIIRLRKEMDTLKEGDRLRIAATDPGFAKDSRSWCSMTGHKLIELREEKGRYIATIEKGGAMAPAATTNSHDKTIVVFSNDLDRALASLVIANGAAASGRKVTMFYTFWGLTVIKKATHTPARKDIIATMMGWMLPSSSLGLGLSKINFGGIGPKLMRFRMKQKRVDSLESLMQQALDAGVRMIACQMSMDVLGVSQDELIDGVTVGGVATYLEASETANLNLFI
jgi:NADPH-dependent 2,4-dienoyl-CoA reductase/sulfur reductase-like enzyme/peroxiredoxin family protein/rhodanese-related sulfurtransferase/TusA-related sulfurtransferase